VVVHKVPVTWETEAGGTGVQGLGKVSEALSQKQNKNKRVRGVTQVVRPWVQSPVSKKKKKQQKSILEESFPINSNFS
jgi:hypothetical protein